MNVAERRRRKLWLIVGVGVACLGVAAVVAARSFAGAKVKIGSKSFTESVILGCMVQQLVQDAGDSTKHREGLGGTRLLWAALQGGEIDVYPEYTGTISKEILTDLAVAGEDEMRAALAEQGVVMSRPLGFDNPYALGMKKGRAAELSITKISDLASHPELKFGFTNEFMSRGDGWPNLRSRYQLPQKDVRGLEHVLAYQALENGSLDVTDLYATDAEIRKHDLQVLQDDRHIFPAYQAVLLYRADLRERAPEAVAAFLKMQGLISADEMATMNARATVDRVSDARVAADFLSYKLMKGAAIREVGPWEKLLLNTLNHLFLVIVSLGAAIVVAVPLGILAARRPAAGQAILATASVLQTVPSLALLVFMVWLLHGQLGAEPAIIALFLYSLLPIVRNTYTGLHDIPIQVRESAEALGLPPLERLWLIELPMASRTILAGIKTSAVINVGNATLGGLIGAGGYGQPIFEGLRRDDMNQIFLQGALPAAVMALVVQGLFELAERGVVPRGLRLKVEG
jgi:osmoprotectant transport system permease protein